VFDPQPSAGDRMDGGAVGAAIVREDRLDADAVAPVEGNGPAQEADGRARLLVRQHLGVGEPAVVVDCDVHELVADRRAPMPVFVGEGAVVVLRAAADTPAGAADDSAQLLDVDVHELAGA
jgi:hypothetical protein